jgi:hypothetical protein
VHSTPRFLQGVYSFEGKGLDRPFLIDPALTYTVPGGSVTQPVYFRGGNASGELICVYLMRDGQPMRYFPIGARNHTHVALRVVEDLEAGTGVELYAAAPAGVAVNVVIDLGLVEVE